MNEESRTYAPGTLPDLPPPASTVGARGWIYHNLLSSPLNIGLSLGSILMVAWVLPPLLDWVFFDAYWGTERTDCPELAGKRVGACWAYIAFWFKQLMYGNYPVEELWRVRVSLFHRRRRPGLADLARAAAQGLGKRVHAGSFSRLSVTTCTLAIPLVWCGSRRRCGVACS